ncbi:MAG: ABC transporter permease [Vicinamibacterales bacterium]
MLLNAASELKYATRALLQRPAYTLMAALTLALGIGANVAIFTVLNGVLLRPLPFPDSGRIVEVHHHAPGLNMAEMQSSPGLIVHYRKNARSLTPMAGAQVRQLNLTGGGAPERVRAIAVTSEMFDVLATRPAMGRAFTDTDVQKGAAAVALLMHGLWQSRFGGDPHVIGKTVELDGRAAEIVGVMPREFVYPDPRTSILVPLPIDPTSGFGSFGMVGLARLGPGVTLDSARTEITQLQQRIPEWFPGLTREVLDGFAWSVSVTPLGERVVGSVSTTLWILFGTVGLVLLIAGANVVNLFLVRAESRQHEFAVRAALGASRSRIATTFLAESLVLAALGGAAGLLIALGAAELLVAYGPAQLPRLQEVRIDPTVIAFTAALTLLSAIVLGLLPALSVARRPMAAAVREGSRGSTSGRTRHRLRHLLIVTQVAMALVLLVGSGLMLRSAARLNAVDPGFAIDGVLTAGVSLGSRADRAQAVNFYHRVLDEVASLPGVDAVGAGSTLPIGGTGLTGSNLAIRSKPRAESEVGAFAMYYAVTDGYFETLGVPLLEGRAPAREDADPGRPGAGVNQAFARPLLDNRAIGAAILIGDRWLEIVGVVGDIRTWGLREEPRPMAYLPLSDASVGVDVMQLAVRTSGAPSALATALRAAIDRVDPSVPLTAIRTMDDLVSASVAQLSFAMTLLLIAAALSLVLGVVGLYGVISYIVGQRTAEIGIRLALGARPARVRAMILRQGLSVAAIGVVVGLVAALALTRLMASMLFEVSTRDPLTFAAVALILTVVSALAIYVPARRASRIDPVGALRQPG